MTVLRFARLVLCLRSVGSCDQFLAELSQRDCFVCTLHAYAIGLAHLFSWLHVSGGDQEHVTRQLSETTSRVVREVPGKPLSAHTLSAERARVSAAEQLESNQDSKCRAQSQP